MSYIIPYPAIDQVLQLISGINELGLSIGKKEGVFRDFSIKVPKYTCYEAGFLKSISWLYMLYNESGKVNVKFLLDRLGDYALDSDNSRKKHITVVVYLRTVFQHSLNFDNQRNIDLKSSTEDWFMNTSGVIYPSDNDHWQMCLETILEESILMFQSLFECTKFIKADEFCELIITDWNDKCERYHPPEKFDRIIGIVASDLGMDHLDPIKVRRRFYDKWSRELDLLIGGYDFEIEARKRIESVLIDNPILPITSLDIMENFDIQPGPQLGKILSLAQNLYKEQPSNAEELLDRIRHEMSIH